MVACPAASGGFSIFDAASLAYLGSSYGVPPGALILPAGDPRCGGLVAPSGRPEKVFLEEPTTISTNTLLVGGAIAAGLIVLAAVV